MSIDLAKLMPAPWDMLPETMRKQIDCTESCWIWLGRTDEKGYGLFHPGSRNPQRVPRLVYEIVNECTLDDETLVCHNCPNGDNPTCCNPAHFFLGSHADNRADCVRKNRQAKGERNGRAILTEQQVAEIRCLYVPRKMSVHKLGRIFGVSGQTVYRIINGEAWNHVA